MNPDAAVLLDRLLAVDALLDNQNRRGLEIRALPNLRSG